MRKGLFIFFLVMGLGLFVGSLFALAEEAAAPVAAVPAPEATAAPAAEEAAVPVEETRWLWAEVIAVDTANKQFTVKYLSYDSDEEKEMVLGIIDTTKFENFPALADMEAGDNVSVDYVMDAGGKALAKSISLQKAKSAAAAPEAATTTEAAAVTPAVGAAVTVAAPTAQVPAATPEAAKPAVEPAATPAAEPAAPVTEQK